MTATELLNKYWDGKLPVDVKAIAEKIGMQVKELADPFDDLSASQSGKIESKEDGTIEIYFNYFDSKVRQRFTIAHEIGHWALGHLKGNNRLFRENRENFYSTAHSSLERDANEFAAQLLMPKRIVHYLIGKKGFGTIEALAKKFEVSNVAMAYRLKKLGVI